MKDNKGSVIVFSTFLMLVLSSIAMMTAFVVFINIKATANSSESIIAYYAAESGLEYNLAEIKQARDAKTETLTSVITTNTDALSNEAEYSSETDNSTTELVFDIAKTETQQIDIYDYDTGGTLLEDDTGSLQVEWIANSACADPMDLQMDITEFDSASWPSLASESSGSIHVFTGPSDTFGLQKDFSYRIKLRPLYCDLENVMVSVYQDGDAVIFPNYITIISEGNFGKTKVELQAKTLWQPSLSGLGEYVLFSEEEICKGESC